MSSERSRSLDPADPWWKGQPESLRGAALPKWLLSLPFLAWSARMVIYERAGRQRNPSSPSLCGGLARPELPVIGAVLSCIRARTYYREPLPEVRGRRGGKTLLRGRFGRGGRERQKTRCASHNSCQEFDRCSTGTRKLPEKVHVRNRGFMPALACQNTTSPIRFKSTLTAGKVGIFRSPSVTSTDALVHG